MGVLLQEENPISLRRAFILDDEWEVYFALDPVEPLKLNSDDLGKNCVYLYRHLRAPSQEHRLTYHWSGAVERDIKPMAFERPPQFRLLWTDSGNSVAVFLNEEPWGFIYEGTQLGYSKGILEPSVGMPWDQDLFLKIFGNIAGSSLHSGQPNIFESCGMTVPIEREPSKLTIAYHEAGHAIMCESLRLRVSSMSLSPEESSSPCMVDQTETEERHRMMISMAGPLAQKQFRPESLDTNNFLLGSLFDESNPELKQRRESKRKQLKTETDRDMEEFMYWWEMKSFVALENWEHDLGWIYQRVLDSEATRSAILQDLRKIEFTVMQQLQRTSEAIEQVAKALASKRSLTSVELGEIYNAHFPKDAYLVP